MFHTKVSENSNIKNRCKYHLVKFTSYSRHKNIYNKIVILKTNHYFLIETYTNFSYIVVTSGDSLIIFLSVFHKCYIDDMIQYYFHVRMDIIKKSLELKYTYYLLQHYLVNG